MLFQQAIAHDLQHAVCIGSSYGLLALSPRREGIVSPPSKAQASRQCQRGWAPPVQELPAPRSARYLCPGWAPQLVPFHGALAGLSAGPESINNIRRDAKGHRLEPISCDGTAEGSTGSSILHDLQHGTGESSPPLRIYLLSNAGVAFMHLLGTCHWPSSIPVTIPMASTA